MVDFKNTVIIMTTNLGSRDISKGVGLGFSMGDDIEGNYDRMKLKVNEELKQHFRPEFLNRLDDVIVFNSLERHDIHKIIDLSLAKVFERIQTLGYKIELTEKAKDFLANKGYDQQYGARPLNRAIQKYLEDLVAEEILKGEISQEDTLMADHEEGKDELKLSVIKKEKA
jgi:ATP-dependent Clp protease ATP-binding subunit ClpC